MKIVMASDLHGILADIPACDLLLLGGDLCPRGNWHEQASWLHDEFMEWTHIVPARQIVGVAGNHDFVLEQAPNLVDHSLIRWQYLQDSSFVFEGIKIHGTPWQPAFGKWAFNAPTTDGDDEPFLTEKFSLIEPDVDIILAHCPPYGICDQTRRAGHLGSRALRQVVEDIAPRLVVCGHVHEAAGQAQLKQTLVVNASLINTSDREASHEPVQWEFVL